MKVLFSKDGKIWTEALPPVNASTVPSSVRTFQVRRNWVLAGLLFLSLPATAFLLLVPNSEPTPIVIAAQAEIELPTESEVEVIVDSIFRSIKTGKTIFIQPKEESSKFKEWMWYLKAREGFIEKPYRCPAGYLTVGYGHNVDAHGWSKASKYMRNGKLTYKGATELLYQDIQEEVNRVTKLAPHLTKNQKLAVASLFANCGSNKVIYTQGKKSLGYSKFWNNVLAGRTPDFSVYTRYRTPSGKVKQSPNLVSARNFEKLLYQGHGKAKIFVGSHKGKPAYQSMGLDEAAAFYREQLVKRDITPAKLANNFE